ncbi:NmrA family NAD(P)-binding protein [Streptomyces sp. NPDC046909]|uniref:NmrA family NAD(P)-binding protein n=1 Tax=Streptomyces sp. NPDC046909 TaxID=3155617 RepID=UPI0033DB87A6
MILVTGVSGGLGGLVYDGLKALGDVEVAGGTRGGDGTTTRRVDFDEPATLAEGFKGVDVLVVISAGYAEDDVVLARHGAVADAAATAGIRHVMYTSLAGSGDGLTIALPHRWTEQRLARGPFALTVLRNGLYPEVPAGLAATGAAGAAETGVFSASLGTGRISVVAKQDLADAAVRVAAETERALAAGVPGPHAGRTYELEGVTAFGGAEIAAVLAETVGRPVSYQDLPLGETRAALTASGALQPYQVGHAVSLFSHAKAGFLEAPADASDLPSLLAPALPRPVRDQIAAATRAGYQGQEISTVR